MIGALKRLRRSDDGYALVLVMLIGVLTTIMLGTATTALVSQIRPSGRSVDSGAAVAAAEAGIEDFVAKVNASCPPTDGFYCAWLTTGVNSNSTVSDPTNQPGTTVTGADGTGTRESFYWKVSYATSGFARVRSTGQVPSGNASPKYLTKTLVADVNATPSYNNFEYYTKFETYAPDFVNSFYAPRTIQITDPTDSSLPGPGTLTWNGACTYVDAQTTPNCDPNHSTNICADLYYPSDAGPGRGTDAAWNNAARRPSLTKQAAMRTGPSYAYYSEQGMFTPASGGSSTAVTHDDTCDSSMEPNMVMNGPVFSEDAYLIDRGDDTGNSQNSMPIFNDYAYSMWNGVINGVQQAPGVNGGYDRSYTNTNGQISTTLNPAPVYTTNKLELPADGSAAKGLATCTYTGPTRIQIKQNVAYITSPGTPTNPSPPGPGYCYASTGTFTNVSGGGVVDAQVPINNTLIYVQNPTSGTPAVATRDNPVFDVSATTPVPGVATTNGLTATWSSTGYSSTAVCPSPSDPTLRRNFDCETGRSNPPEDVWANIQAAVNSTLAAGYATPADLQAALIASIDAQMNTGALSSTNLVSRGYYYQVAVALPTLTTTAGQAQSLAPNDPFYQLSTSGGFTTTTLTTGVTITRCTSSSCSGSNATTLVRGNVSAALSIGTPIVTTESWPWFGAQSGTHTYTDANNDITPYYNGYGDAYVEGTLNGSMSIVAEHDIVATNDLVYNNTDLRSTTDGLALVANHNVRIYRPMTCTDDGTAGQTSPGYCPNDLTGVYNKALSWPLQTNNATYPSLKYTPDNAPAMSSTGQGIIDATIFTLRGSFMVDNFYRGVIGVGTTVTGGLYQYHRGPTSLPYQGRPYQGSTTKMPGVTLTYTYDNMRAGETPNGGLRVPWIPTPQNRPVGSNKTWNVVSISTAS